MPDIKKLLNLRPETVGEGFVELLLTAHLAERCLQRGVILPKSNDGVALLLAGCRVMPRRPRQISILLKHECRDAVYLFSSQLNLVFVLEESRSTREITILTTVYSSRESDWCREVLSRERAASMPYLADCMKALDLKVRWTVSARRAIKEAETLPSPQKTGPQRQAKAGQPGEVPGIPAKELEENIAAGILQNDPVVAEIAGALEEEHRDAIAGIQGLVHAAALDCVREWCDRAVWIQNQGGMPLPDGSDKRSTGGIFFALAKAELPKDTFNQAMKRMSLLKRQKRAKLEACSSELT